MRFKHSLRTKKGPGDVLNSGKLENMGFGVVENWNMKGIIVTSQVPNSPPPHQGLPELISGLLVYVFYRIRETSILFFFPSQTHPLIRRGSK